MFKVYIFIILLFSASFSSASGGFFQIESVDQEDDTIRLNLTFAYAQKLRETNNDSALFYFNMAVDMASQIIAESKYSSDEIETVKLKKAESLEEIGKYYYSIKYDYDNSLKYYEQALNVYRQLTEDENTGRKNTFLNLEAQTMLTVGVICFDNDDFVNSLDFYNRALEIGKLLNEGLIESKALLNMGMIYNNQGRYDDAIANYFEAIKKFKQLDDEKGIAISYLSIGNIMRKQNTVEKAIENYKNALEMFKKMGDERGECACYNNLGICYASIDDFDTGLEYYNKTLEVHLRDNNQNEIASTYSNIAALYESKREFDKSVEYVRKALKIAKENGFKRSLMGAYINLSGTLLSKVESDLSLIDSEPSVLDTIIIYCEKGLALTDSMHLILEKISALIILKEASVFKRNYKRAYEVTDLLVDLKDSVYNSEKAKIIAEVENSYEAEQKEQQIEQQKHELEDQQLRLSNAKLFRNFLVAVLFLTVIIILFTYYYYRQKHKANKVLNDKNKLIEKQNQEIIVQKEELLRANDKLTELVRFKEKMTGMIVHDLKNPLNNILNSHEIDDKHFREQLIKQSGYDMLNLTQNILDVYKLEETKMKIIEEEVNVMQTIRECIMEVGLYISEKELKIIYPEEDFPRIRADKRLLRRIFSNLLSNAVKYASGGSKISISWRIENKTDIWFGVNNHGPVIPEDQQILIFQSFCQHESRDMGIASSTGLGLSFCKMAVELHKGKIGVKSDENGTEFWFVLHDRVFV